MIASTVAAVGEFRELCMWADKDRALCETLKKVLKLTKGWDAAKEHAMQAVTSDHQLRIWSAEPNSGLIFKCFMGVVDIEKPIGAALPPSSITMPAYLDMHVLLVHIRNRYLHLPAFAALVSASCCLSMQRGHQSMIITAYRVPFHQA